MKHLRILTALIALCLLSGWALAQGPDPSTSLPESADAISPITVNSPLPELHLLTADGNPFSVQDALTNQPLVLIF